MEGHFDYQRTVPLYLWPLQFFIDPKSTPIDPVGSSIIRQYETHLDAATITVMYVDDMTIYHQAAEVRDGKRTLRDLLTQLEGHLGCECSQRYFDSILRNLGDRPDIFKSQDPALLRTDLVRMLIMDGDKLAKVSGRGIFDEDLEAWNALMVWYRDNHEHLAGGSLDH